MIKSFIFVLTLLLMLLFNSGVFAQSVETQSAIMDDLSRRVGTTVTFNQVTGSGWTWNQGPYNYVVGLEDGCPAAPLNPPAAGNWNRYTFSYQNVTFKYIVSDDAQSVILCNQSAIQAQIPPTLAPTATTLAPIGAVCEMPTQLVIGGQGRVTPGDPNWVHAEARRNSTKAGEIPGDGAFTVLEGPACDAESGIHYWRVRYGDLEGWTGEGLAGEYWIVPTGTATINPLTLDQIGELDTLAAIEAQHPNGVKLLAFSPDGQLLATTDDQNIYLWETGLLGGDANLRPTTILPVQSGVKKLLFAPNNQSLVAFNETTIQLWTVSFTNTGNPPRLALLANPAGAISRSGEKIQDVMFSPDGSLLAIVTDRTLTVGAASSQGITSQSRSFAVEGLATVTFSPDGTVLIGQSAEGNVIGLWGVGAGARG